MKNASLYRLSKSNKASKWNSRRKNIQVACHVFETPEENIPIEINRDE